MAARILPPTDRDPGWKGFGGLPERWNRGTVGRTTARTPVHGEVLHSAGRAAAELSEHIEILHEPASVAFGAHPYIVRALAAPTSSVVLGIAAGSTCDEPLLLSTVIAAGQTRSVPITEIRVGAGARCTIDERLGFQNAGEMVEHTSSTVLRVEAGADVTWRTTIYAPEKLLAILHRQIFIAAGATVRLDLDVAGRGRVMAVSTQTLTGENAFAQMAGAIRIGDDARFSHRVLQEVQAPGGTTRFVERMVAEGRAKAIFLGGIHLAPAAQRADSAQSHRALLLSDDASSSATPSLEIEADDVRCSHGATTSRLDDDQRFYLLSRGIPEVETVTMLVDAFLAGAGLTPLSPVPVHAAT